MRFILNWDGAFRSDIDIDIDHLPSAKHDIDAAVARLVGRYSFEARYEINYPDDIYDGQMILIEGVNIFNVAHSGTEEFLTQWIAAGCSEDRDASRKNALHHAAMARYYNHEVMGAGPLYPEERFRRQERTEAEDAASARRIQILLACGVDASAIDRDGLTPLHIACLHKRPQTILTLLRNSEDLHAEVTSRIPDVHYGMRDGMLIDTTISPYARRTLQEFELLHPVGHNPFLLPPPPLIVTPRMPGLSVIEMLCIFNHPEINAFLIECLGGEDSLASIYREQVQLTAAARPPITPLLFGAFHDAPRAAAAAADLDDEAMDMDEELEARPGARP